MSDITVNETGTIELRCSANGNPSPVITWTKHGNATVIHEGNVYIKKNASRFDAGLYQCTANNSIGKPVHAQATVVVNCKFAFIQSFHFTKTVTPYC
jgi:hypothetical protein